MKTAICHYSLRRLWAAQKWTLDQLVKEVEKLGVEQVDFHIRFLGDPRGAGKAILAALAHSRVTLSGLSMGNDFNQADPAKFKAQVEEVKTWLAVAEEVKAPVSRIFGGTLPREQRGDPDAKAAARQRILDGLSAVLPDAQKRGVILGLENHGGLPCSAEEQVDVIHAVHSPWLRATVDVGNYMECGQEPHVGCAVAAPVAAYVHFKDFRRVPDATRPRGFRLEARALGEGEADLHACIRALRKVGYHGSIALEYEAEEDERTAVPRCIACMKKVIAEA